MTSRGHLRLIQTPASTSSPSLEEFERGADERSAVSAPLERTRENALLAAMEVAWGEGEWGASKKN